MKKNKIKILLIIMQILIIFSYNVVFAGSELTNGIDINKNQINQFIKPTSTIITVLQAIGILSSIVALMLMGIKYMLASVEGKAEYKKSFPLYLVGIIFVFGVSVFARTIDQLISNI